VKHRVSVVAARARLAVGCLWVFVSVKGDECCVFPGSFRTKKDVVCVCCVQSIGLVACVECDDVATSECIGDFAMQARRRESPPTEVHPPTVVYVSFTILETPLPAGGRRRSFEQVKKARQKNMTSVWVCGCGCG
jgi:hypothetical protein